MPSQKEIDRLRGVSEPEVLWTLRREFLAANWDNEDVADNKNKDRLSALSMAYQNMEVLGCSYPSLVEQQVKRMSEGLVNDGSKKLGQQKRDVDKEEWQKARKQRRTQ